MNSIPHDNMGKEKFLFLDYDECLVNSLYVSGESEGNSFLNMYSEYFRGELFRLAGVNENYVSFLRPSAKRIVEKSQNLLGKENVFILSTGTLDYVRTSSQKLELGIPFENIFGREDLRRCDPCERFMYSHNVLVDNEVYEYHVGKFGKVAFLNNLPKDRYIQVRRFDVLMTTFDREDFAEWVIQKIREKMEI